LAVAEEVLTHGIDVVGMGTALAMSPSLPNDWKNFSGLGIDSPSAHNPIVRWKDKTLSSIATMAVIKRQLQRMGKGKQPKANVSAIFSLIRDRIRLKKLTKRYQQYLAKQLG
jgi:hypothetical protein